MKISYFLLVIALLSVLISCKGEINTSHNFHPNAEETTEISINILQSSEASTTESANTDTELSSDTESSPIDQDTQTEPPKIEPEPIIIPEIPDALHTNIDIPDAKSILYEIYCTASAKENVSVYYADVNREFYFGINEDQKYHSASTIKAVYAQYIISSGIDLSNEIVFTEQNRTSSSGKLNYSAIGKSFTVEELLRYTIRDSDNQAYRLLYDTFGTSEYNNYVASIGVRKLTLGNEYEWRTCSPKDLSYAMIEIYFTGEENSILIDHLKNTTYNQQIAAGTPNETAHKYGYNGKDTGYHDTAIVYAQNRPYVLTVMTLLDPADPETDLIFQKLTELCDKLNELLYCD